MTPLNTLDFPLSGPALIEASAGTGKTYTIVNLYLRLLLGHGCAPLTVDKILVVTFTKAATAELKERVRKRLHSAYLDFYQQSSADGFVQSLIDESDDLTEAKDRLELAIKQMDEAAIFTIHSFCQRMLTLHAFESGVLYEQTFVNDEFEWQKLAVEDYWRQYIANLPTPLLQQVLSLWQSPFALHKSIRSLLHRQWQTETPIKMEQAIDAFEQIQQQTKAIKTWWLESGIASTLQQSFLKGNTLPGKAKTYEAMLSYCQSEEITPPFDKKGWSVFSSDSIEKARSKKSPDLSAYPWHQFDQLDLAWSQCKKLLKNAFSQQALEVIEGYLAEHKTRLNLLAPDDLLSKLQSALGSHNGGALRQAIQTAFPAALIDEFQDTDPTQFFVFKNIYQAQSELPAEAPCWIMIGDPKQAIYAFRGADIFTYIEAKSLVPPERHFTLATNWRSQQKLVDSVNGLFAKSECGFLFNESIPFFAVKSAQAVNPIKCDGETISSLNFSLVNSDNDLPVGVHNAQQTLATYTASKIAYLLNQQATVDGRVIKAGDCCVLVRDRNEADVIKQALNKANVDCVFLSRKSVFDSQTARDLYLILSAMANPHNERNLKAALATELLCKTASELDSLFSDDVAWHHLVESCLAWQTMWQQQGVMMMLNHLASYFLVAENVLQIYEDGLRRITDLRHLTELLQEQSAVIQGESQLLHWFSQHVLNPDHDNEVQQLRLETDQNLVQIITMHASKGLEFPLVFIPFSAKFRAAKEAIFHDAQNRLKIDYSPSPEQMQLAERERLAEDIRLLYVALTRAVYGCFVGIWNNANAKSKKVSEFKQTAIGSLLLSLEGSATDDAIRQAILNLSSSVDISLTELNGSEPIVQMHEKAIIENDDWQASKLDREIVRNWRLTSYSAISRQQAHLETELPGLDEGQPAIDTTPLTVDVNSRFSFTKGAQAGSFLHGVLENIELHAPQDLPAVIEQQGQWFGIEEQWYPLLYKWIDDVLQSPFSIDRKLLRLADLKPQNTLVEMEFHLPLHNVKVTDFNRIINKYFVHQQRNYQFDTLNGMLKGFIDLTFCHNDVYYVADYKSNHLGNEIADYNEVALTKAMEEHDYHLQAILYVLAMHRWLKSKLTNYQYHQHIGGAYYLFLRGMSAESPNSGVYHLRPDWELISELDALFDGQQSSTIEHHESQEQLDLW